MVKVPKFSEPIEVLKNGNWINVYFKWDSESHGNDSFTHEDAIISVKSAKQIFGPHHSNKPEFFRIINDGFISFIDLKEFCEELNPEENDDDHKGLIDRNKEKWNALNEAIDDIENELESICDMFSRYDDEYDEVHDEYEIGCDDSDADSDADADEAYDSDSDSDAGDSKDAEEDSPSLLVKRNKPNAKSHQPTPQKRRRLVVPAGYDDRE